MDEAPQAQHIAESSDAVVVMDAPAFEREMHLAPMVDHPLEQSEETAEILGQGVQAVGEQTVDLARGGDLGDDGVEHRPATLHRDLGGGEPIPVAMAMAVVPQHGVLDAVGHGPERSALVDVAPKDAHRTP